jgi:hypothetical protein
LIPERKIAVVIALVAGTADGLEVLDVIADCVDPSMVDEFTEVLRLVAVELQARGEPKLAEGVLRIFERRITNASSL